jgi:DNA-binding CsgD family transcriptional regulator
MKNLYAVQDIVQYNAGIGKKLLTICEPIFSNFGFSSFGYTRIQNNGNRLILETNKDWLNYYGDAGFQEKNDGPKSLLGNIERLIVNPPPEEFHIQVLTGPPKSKLHENLQALNVWNSVSIYVQMNNYFEVYHLAMSDQDDSIIMDLCINKKFLLQRFFHYFREKICLLDVDKAPYISDNNVSKIFSNDKNLKIGIPDTVISNYLTQTHTGKFYLKTHDMFITRRAAECLHYLAFGKTCKEIARLLQISPRTVEFYLNALKDKTLVHSKSELIRLAYENYLAIPGLFDTKEAK